MRRQEEQRGPGVALFLVLGVLAAALVFVLAKLALRRSRYFTRDPRRIAAACRRELVEFLRDQRIDVPPSAGTHELGEFLGRRAGVDATELADALGRARYGPLPEAREAAREARHEVKGVRRGLRQALPPGRRFRGLFSLRSLLAKLVEAIVMAAGEGLRLRPITERWPKPILPIDGRAVLATLIVSSAPRGSGRSRW